MRACIVYSSCTGNTRKVAEAMAEASGITCHAVRHAPSPQEYDLLAVGFWVRQGLPDARAQRYIQTIHNKNVFYFGTLGAWPQSEHALRCSRATAAMLEQGGNTVLDGFLCQGKVSPQVVAASQRKGTHPMTAARQERLREAARHPDAEDLQAACQRWLHSLKTARATLHHQGFQYA